MLTNTTQVEYTSASVRRRGGMSSLEQSEVSQDESQREQNDAPDQSAPAGHPTHDGLLIVDGSGKIEPLGQSSSRAWQVPKAGGPCR